MWPVSLFAPQGSHLPAIYLFQFGEKVGRPGYNPWFIASTDDTNLFGFPHTTKKVPP